VQSHIRVLLADQTSAVKFFIFSGFVFVGPCYPSFDWFVHFM